MSAVPTTLPKWAEAVSDAMSRAACHNLAAVSVPTDGLLKLWRAWRDEKEQADKAIAELNRLRESSGTLRTKYQRAFNALNDIASTAQDARQACIDQ